MSEVTIAEKLVVSVYKDDRIVEGYPPDKMVYIKATKKRTRLFLSRDEDETDQALLDSLVPPFDDIFDYPRQRFCGFEYADFFKKKSKKLLSEALSRSCYIPNEYMPKVLDEIYLVFRNVFPRKIRASDVVGLVVNVTIASYVRAPPGFTRYNNNDQVFYRVKPASKTAVESLEKVLLFKGLDEGCAICMEDMEAGVEATRMPCKHYFHSNCIRRWLVTNHVCPLCRFKLANDN